MRRIVLMVVLVLGLAFGTLASASGNTSVAPAQAGLRALLAATANQGTVVYNLTLVNDSDSDIANVYAAVPVPQGLAGFQPASAPPGSWFRGIELGAAAWLLNRVPAKGSAGPFSYTGTISGTYPGPVRAFVRWLSPSDGTVLSDPVVPSQTGNGSAGLSVTADTVQAAENLPPDQMPQRACVEFSRFARNSTILWRARVVDPLTGDPMDDTALAKVEVHLADGTILPTKFGPHPATGAPNPDHFWSVAWRVPKDYPTGTLGYSIVATSKDGRTGEFKPFNVLPSLLTITQEVLPDQPPPPAR